jgi:hypothetical protein
MPLSGDGVLRHMFDQAQRVRHMQHAPSTDREEAKSRGAGFREVLPRRRKYARAREQWYRLPGSLVRPSMDPVIGEPARLRSSLLTPTSFMSAPASNTNICFSCLHGLERMRPCNMLRGLPQRQL